MLESRLLQLSAAEEMGDGVKANRDCLRASGLGGDKGASALRNGTHEPGPGPRGLLQWSAMVLIPSSGARALSPVCMSVRARVGPGAGAP
jgi:hypothetical protein